MKVTDDSIFPFTIDSQYIYTAGVVRERSYTLNNNKGAIALNASTHTHTHTDLYLQRSESRM